MSELNINNAKLIRIVSITYPPEENPQGTPSTITVSNYCNIIISKNEWELNPNKIYWITDEIIAPNYIYFSIKNNKLKINNYDRPTTANWKILVEQLF
ncbi:hypothetical protein [Fusobacterium ulcerans]|uniref:hypothetical protein n=1 Tax=Fusobacterium ulcerans TaxID=861 RepID=UPI0030A1F66A